jgi:NACHT domain
MHTFTAWLSITITRTEHLLAQWRFDPITSLVTVVFAPLLLFLLAILLKWLKEHARYALEGELYWASLFLRQSLAARLTLRWYCRLQLAGPNKYLYVPSRADVKLEIDRVFTTLVLEQQVAAKRTYTHSDILTVGNRIRLIGDPGSGKSSLVKRLLRDSCARAGEKQSELRLPIMLELKNFDVPAQLDSDKLGQFLYDFLRSEACKSAVYKMAECFDTYAQTNGLLVLLDGLDEIPSTGYSRVEAAIQGLSRHLEQLSDRNIVVLTMRSQFHQQIKEHFRESFGHALFLKPFTPSDIYEFLTRWPFAGDKRSTTARIFKDLTDRPTLREMCANPLVLSMYVAEDQAAGYGSSTPDSRTEFYAKVTEELLLRRRLKQTGPAVAPSKLLEQRERMLGRLAFEHLLDPSQPANCIGWEHAIRVIRGVMKCGREDAERTFDELAKETGLISEERRRQSLRFIHLTFCEFLAAYEAVQGQKDGWTRLLESHRQFLASTHGQLVTRLLEVIPFAAGLLPRVKREEALSDLEKLSDLPLAARGFLETKLYDHPGWPTLVDAERRTLLNTPEEKWDEQWLRDLHLFNVVVRDANQSAQHAPVAGGMVDLAEFFKDLVSLQQDSLSTLLSAYATQDAAAAMRLAEVCQLDLAKEFPEIVISFCDQAPFLALLQEQALREASRIGLWCSLFAEGALRSYVVAARMAEKQPEVTWANYVNEVPRKMRWLSAPGWERLLTRNA